MFPKLSFISLSLNTPSSSLDITCGLNFIFFFEIKSVMKIRCTFEVFHFWFASWTSLIAIRQFCPSADSPRPNGRSRMDVRNCGLRLFSKRKTYYHYHLLFLEYPSVWVSFLLIYGGESWRNMFLHCKKINS